MPTDLAHWLDYIGQVHPREIELGLERTATIAERLTIIKPPTVITVAGTNGKGSVVGVMERFLCQADASVGSYTSPHIDRFNERIRIGGEPVSDALICAAFAAIESARRDISLSYFEFATLAALLVFQQQNVTTVLLEVGLGGRLDAVNIIDPDVSVITSIGLDHQDWLGHDRDTISLEKAGILRQGSWFVCGDAAPPSALLSRAKSLGCKTLCVGQEFKIEKTEPGTGSCWHGQTPDGALIEMELPEMPGLQPDNIATAVQALCLAGLAPDSPAQLPDLPHQFIPGRQELRRDISTGRQLLFDVAHNPDAMLALGSEIQAMRDSGRVQGRVGIVLAIMADKDVESMLVALESQVDIWYIAQVEEPRCMPAVELGNRLQRLIPTEDMTCFESVQDAYHAACVETGEKDLVIVAGSFFTVAAVRQFSRDAESNRVA